MPGLLTAAWPNATRRMNGSPLCLGLHITKCAGTSLMTTLRRTLSDDEYYFFSSYHENWLASRPLFGALRSPERLRVVFGHYFHETLLAVFSDRPVYLFTGLRNPVERAVSGLRQVNAVAARHGRPPIDAERFLATHRNPFCTEILRALPSIAAGPAPLWQKARAALSLFDLITSTEHFESHALKILAVIDGPAKTIVNDNISAEKSLPPGTERFIERACETLRENADAHLGDDLRLYREFAPMLGKPDLRANIAACDWALDRAAFIATLPSPDEAKRRFCARETDFMLAEFAELGRLAELRAWLCDRATEADQAARRIVVPA
jgi:hypothetical protein